MLCENKGTRGQSHASELSSSALRGCVPSSECRDSLSSSSLSSCPSAAGHGPFVGRARAATHNLGPPGFTGTPIAGEAPILNRYSRTPQGSPQESEDEFCTSGGTDTWQRVGRDAVQHGEWEIASKLSVFPVRYVGGAGVPQWEKISFVEIKEIFKAARFYGRESAYFRGLLQATFSANVFTPHDLKHLCTSLLSPTEHSLWELAWKHLLNELLRGYARTPATVNLTIDQLAGEGTYTDPQRQARLLNRQVLQDIKEAAKAALLHVPDGNKPELDFTEIKQGMDEPYIKILDCLKLALDKQIPIDRAREELLKRLAISNANPNCKKILRALPQEPEPTLTQLVDACNCLDAPEHAAAMQAEVLANAITTAQENTLKQQEKAVEIQAQTLAEAVTAFKGAIENQQTPKDTCYLCGQRGHFKRECPKLRRKPLPKTVATRVLIKILTIFDQYRVVHAIFRKTCRRARISVV
uniref:CCHC-type domain-containing protein n=1 Tax=Taeniopygia guttata TaxID=59729 RepID=A0A674GI07_TAEGU